MLLHPLLAGVPPAVRMQVARFVQLRHCQRNEVLLHVDEPRDFLYAVASGLIRVVAPRGTDETEWTTTDFLGINSIYLDAPRGLGTSGSSMTALVAVVPSAVYTLPLRVLLHLCEQHPSVPLKLLELQLDVARGLRHHVARLDTLPAQEMVGSVLEDLARIAPTGNNSVSKRISQSVIASFAGLSRGVVNKAIKDMEELGRLSKSGDSIQINLPAHINPSASGLRVRPQARGKNDQARGAPNFGES